MKVKVDVAHLRLGMFVSELDRPWVGTPFLFQGFEIRTLEELARLRAACQYVYVLIGERHDNVAFHATPVPDHPDPTEAQGHELRVLEPEPPERGNGDTDPRKLPEDLVPIEEEIGRATEIGL